MCAFEIGWGNGSHRAAIVEQHIVCSCVYILRPCYFCSLHFLVVDASASFVSANAVSDLFGLQIATSVSVAVISFYKFQLYSDNNEHL